MNNFDGDLIAQQLEGGFHWRIYEAFTYRIGDPNGKWFVRIPKGFVTDFASIPRGLWNLWPPACGKHSKPAVVHDFLYRFAYVEDGKVKRPITREDADDVFKEAMEVAGVSWLSRWLIFTGVRVGGRAAWARSREAEHVGQVS